MRASSFMRWRAVCFLAACVLVARATEEEAIEPMPDFQARTPPPFMEIQVLKDGEAKSVDNLGAADMLTLLSTSVTGTVTDGLYHGTTSQVYRHDGDATSQPIFIRCFQATYVYPLAKDSTVVSVKATFGSGRTVESAVRAREAADVGAHREGLANYVSLQIGNIKPADNFTVEVEYVEQMAFYGGIYAFTFPALRGPVYRNPDDSVHESVPGTVDASYSESVPASIGGNGTVAPFSRNGEIPASVSVPQASPAGALVDMAEPASASVPGLVPGTVSRSVSDMSIPASVSQVTSGIIPAAAAWSSPEAATTYINLKFMGGYRGMASNLAATESEKAKYTTVLVDRSEGQADEDVVIRYWFTKDTSTFRMHAVDFESIANDDGRYFMLSVHPPQRRYTDYTNYLRHEYVLIVDANSFRHSFDHPGSSEANNRQPWLLDHLTKLIEQFVDIGREKADNLNIITFGSRSGVWSRDKSTLIDLYSAKDAVTWLRTHVHGRTQRTDFLSSLAYAYSTINTDLPASRTIIAVTNGHIKAEGEVFDLIRSNLWNCNLFVVGVGENPNVRTLDGLARAGHSKPFYAKDNVDAVETFAKLRDLVSMPVMANLNITCTGGCNWQPHSLNPGMPSWPSVFVDRPVQVIGKYLLPPNAVMDGTIRLVGMFPNGLEFVQELNLTDVTIGNSLAMPIEWARARVATLQDYPNWNTHGEDLNELAIAELGLKFGLMTEYTAFEGKESQPGIDDAGCRTYTADLAENTIVNQPLLLPRGAMSWHRQLNSNCIGARMGLALGLSVFFAFAGVV